VRTPPHVSHAALTETIGVIPLSTGLLNKIQFHVISIKTSSECRGIHKGLPEHSTLLANANPYRLPVRAASLYQSGSWRSILSSGFKGTSSRNPTYSSASLKMRSTTKNVRISFVVVADVFGTKGAPLNRRGEYGFQNSSVYTEHDSGEHTLGAPASFKLERNSYRRHGRGAHPRMGREKTQWLLSLEEFQEFTREPWENG
jgi:hypothetical protein